MSDTINTNAAPAPVGAYPHAKRAGDLVFLSGLGPREPDGTSVPGNRYDEAGELLAYDIEAQTRAVFANLNTVLQAAGLTRSDLVDVTVFVTNMQRDFATVNRLYAELMAPANPCRTTVEIGALPTPIAIELKCIAYSPSR